ncbi:MAG: tRNA (adenosine(37)-N6)-threonylcarbamoyltransferase complex dimerization subunit type 1 TsaB [Anaerolineae bacterium]|nr:tRNA (adenosine(37)-N6)-threonylcarbamoyltransferase complex dimerization subunit type 1 TsaB [Anaerolineae bacterium]
MLLAVDTSTRYIGLALYDGSAVVSESTWQTQNHHTIELAPAIQALFARSGLAPTQLEALAIALGPGSFTSLRIGLSLVKGMALALHVPVVGIPTLDILAVAQPLQDAPLAAVLQAGRGRLALVWYAVQEGGWVAQGAPVVTTAEALRGEISKPTLVAGELSAEERQLFHRKWRNALVVSPAGCTRRPGVLAELAWARWQAGDVDDPATLSPIYVHVSEAIPD